MMMYVCVLGDAMLDSIEFASVFVGGNRFTYRDGENTTNVWPGMIRAQIEK